MSIAIYLMLPMFGATARYTSPVNALNGDCVFAFTPLYAQSPHSTADIAL